MYNVVVKKSPAATTRFRYDADNRLIEKLVSVSDVEKYSYASAPMLPRNCTGQALPPQNSQHRLSSVEDAVGTWYFGYTDDGLLAWEALASKGASCAKTLQWTRTPSGLLTSMTYPSGAVVELSYPAAGAAAAERPSGLTLVVGTTRTTLLSAVRWEAGELKEYTSAGSQWRLSRDSGGLPAGVLAVSGRVQT